MAEHASWEMVGKGCGRVDNYGGGNGVVRWGFTNVVRRCALRMIQSKKKLLDKVMLKEALQKEKIKS